jgi:hypothetical protein
MNRALTYLVRRMNPQAVRDTYPLAMLQIPGLSLAAWRQTVRRLSSDEATLGLLVVYNAGQCAVAVVRHSAAGFAFVLQPPALLADSARIIEAVQACLAHAV